MKDGPKEKIWHTEAEKLVLPMAFLKAVDASHSNPILGDVYSQKRSLIAVRSITERVILIRTSAVSNGSWDGPSASTNGVK